MNIQKTNTNLESKQKIMNRYTTLSKVALLLIAVLSFCGELNSASIPRSGENEACALSCASIKPSGFVKPEYSKINNRQTRPIPFALSLIKTEQGASCDLEISISVNTDNGILIHQEAMIIQMEDDEQTFVFSETYMPACGQALSYIFTYELRSLDDTLIDQASFQLEVEYQNSYLIPKPSKPIATSDIIDLEEAHNTFGFIFHTTQPFVFDPFGIFLSLSNIETYPASGFISSYLFEIESDEILDTMKLKDLDLVCSNKIILDTVFQNLDNLLVTFAPPNNTCVYPSSNSGSKNYLIVINYELLVPNTRLDFLIDENAYETCMINSIAHDALGLSNQFGTFSGNIEDFPTDIDEIELYKSCQSNIWHTYQYLIVFDAYLSCDVVSADDHTPSSFQIYPNPISSDQKFK